MDEAHVGHKKLVLSAARTDQHGVRIDLYRSVDGTCHPENSLGIIALDGTEGLGFLDIEFRIDLDEDGLLEASAALPGQAPRTLSVDLTPFQSSRSDADILADADLAEADLDTLDDSFATDTFTDDDQPADLAVLDLPSLDEEELTTLDDFTLETLDDEAGGAEEVLEAPSAPEAFDLGDLDAGFGDSSAVAEELGTVEPDDTEGWEKISLDDLEPMEFMDTGDEISRPSSKPSPAPVAKHEFSMDDDQPLELGDLDGDLTELPELDDFVPQAKKAPVPADDSLDEDFMELEELADEPAAPAPAALPPSKAAKSPKPAKAPKGHVRAGDSDDFPGGLDKTALFLSLSALSLLVLLILVLLFLNMIKAPQAPVIQPEVMLWKPVAGLSVPAAGVSSPEDIDLAVSAPTFPADTVLEIPRTLQGARISLRLAPGETLADAGRRFGEPVRTQGDQLFW